MSGLSWWICGIFGGPTPLQSKSRLFGWRCSADCSKARRLTRLSGSTRRSTAHSPSHHTSAISRGPFTMNAIRRFLGVVVLCVLGAGPVQGQSWYALTYQPAQPLSNTQDFTSTFGWRGIGLDYRAQVKPNFALGLSFAWQVFDEQTDEVVSAFGVDLSGDQFRYVNSFPMLANASYFFGKPGGLRPFLGANLGAYVMQHRLD